MPHDASTTRGRASRPLPARPVTPAAFARYGWIVQAGDSGQDANNGTARRHDIHAYPSAALPADARLVTSIFEVTRQPPDAPITLLERHVNSIQLIVPLGGAGHVVIVSDSGEDGGPDLSTLAAFRFSAAQGMIYRQGLWHHPIMAIGADARFLVQSWQDGSAADCEIRAIEPRAIAL